MRTPAKLNDLNHVKELARRLLGWLGWICGQQTRRRYTKRIVYGGSDSMSDGGRGFHPPGLTFLPDVSPARWVEEGLGREFATVGALIPRGFASYVRLFHPARDENDGRVRWAEVAGWSGRTVHPLMAFEGISAPVSGFGTGDAPWSEDPTHGSLDEDDAIALAGFLAGFTGTPDRSFFAVWEGYGQFSPGGMSVLSYPGGSKALSPPDEVLTAGRIKGIGRDYLLYAGPLTAIVSFFAGFWHDSPSIWWPEDRAWCVATDIDLDTTYVGGAAGCIDALMNSPSFEVLPATIGAPVHMQADTLNLP